MSEVEEMLRGYGAGFRTKRTGMRFENGPADPFVITEFGPMRLAPKKHGYKTERPRPGKTMLGTVISDDLGRAYRWMEKKPRKPRRDSNPPGQRPSELARATGIQLTKKFGIVVCKWRFAPKSCESPCGYLIIAERGEKLKRCGGCGRRVWVSQRKAIFEHDDLRVVRRVVSGIKGWQGRGGSVISLLSPAKINEWARRAEVSLSSSSLDSGGRGSRNPLRSAKPHNPDGGTNQAPDPQPPFKDLAFSPKKASDSTVASPVRDLGGARREATGGKDSGPRASPSLGRPRRRSNSG